MRTSFGSPRRHVLIAVISTLSLFDSCTRRPPLRLRPRCRGARESALPGVRVVLVSTVGPDRAGEGDVPNRRVGAELLRPGAAQVDVPAPLPPFPVPAPSADADVSADRMDHPFAVPSL